MKNEETRTKANKKQPRWVKDRGQMESPQARRDRLRKIRKSRSIRNGESS